MLEASKDELEILRALCKEYWLKRANRDLSLILPACSAVKVIKYLLTPTVSGLF